MSSQADPPRMSRFRWIACAILVTLLMACTTVEVAPSDARVRTAEDLGMDPRAIVHQQPARFASVTPGEWYAKFQFGLYTQTRSDLIFFSYDAVTKSFTRVLTLPLNQIDQVAVESWGLFDQLKQMQIKSGGMILVVNFSNSSDAMAGYPAATKAAHDPLLAAGVTPGPRYGRVMPVELKNFVIPIFLPVR